MTIEVIKGDITLLEVDAIVNVANTSLLGGLEGIDGAIHRAGGKQVIEGSAFKLGTDKKDVRLVKQ